MISNDLGEGVILAGHRYAALSEYNTSKITNESICFCNEILAVILNTSAAIPFRLLDELADEAVKTVSDRYRLELMIFKKEGFDLGEE